MHRPCLAYTARQGHLYGISRRGRPELRHPTVWSLNAQNAAEPQHPQTSNNLETPSVLSDGRTALILPQVLWIANTAAARRSQRLTVQSTRLLSTAREGSGTGDTRGHCFLRPASIAVASGATPPGLASLRLSGASSSCPRG